MTKITIKGRLSLPSELQGTEFRLDQLRLQKNDGVTDGLEIAVGIVQAERNDGTLAAIFLDAESAKELSKALNELLASLKG